MKICWARYVFLAVIVVMGVGAMLSACGHKGKLYLPGSPEAIKQEKRTQAADEEE